MLIKTKWRLEWLLKIICPNEDLVMALWGFWMNLSGISGIVANQIGISKIIIYILASYIHMWRAIIQAGIINDAEAIEAKLKAVDFESFGRKICSLDVGDIGELYPTIDENDRAYLCMDLVYEYGLLVEGFGIHFIFFYHWLHHIFSFYFSTVDHIWSCNFVVLFSGGHRYRQASRDYIDKESEV